MRFVIEIHECSADVYRAACFALPGCEAIGYTAEDARSRMDGAIRTYLQSFDTAGVESVEIGEAVSSTSNDSDTSDDFEETFIG